MSFFQHLIMPNVPQRVQLLFTFVLEIKSLPPLQPSSYNNLKMALLNVVFFSP